MEVVTPEGLGDSARSDGIEIALTEVHARGTRREIQLKGSGPTPFSRPGSDGFGAIGPMLREYLVSEFMHAVGVPTTRALAAVATGETVVRERPLPGAVLTRVAASHLRIGTLVLVATQGSAGLWGHLARNVLPVALRDTAILLVGVGGIVASIGVINL